MTINSPDEPSHTVLFSSTIPANTLAVGDGIYFSVKRRSEPPHELYGEAEKVDASDLELAAYGRLVEEWLKMDVGAIEWAIEKLSVLGLDDDDQPMMARLRAMIKGEAE